MNKWPVETPIDPNPPSINLRGEPPDPETFVGPLNLFTQLHDTATAQLHASQVKKEYDDFYAANPPAAAKAEPVPAPAPPIKPVSAGTPIDTAGVGEVDPGIRDRVSRHHHQRPIDPSPG